jgi:hypothetical protein
MLFIGFIMYIGREQKPVAIPKEYLPYIKQLESFGFKITYTSSGAFSGNPFVYMFKDLKSVTLYRSITLMGKMSTTGQGSMKFIIRAKDPDRPGWIDFTAASHSIEEFDYEFRDEIRDYKLQQIC